MGKKSKSGLSDAIHTRRFQVKLIFEGALVGIVGGGIVTFYRCALSFAEKTMRTALNSHAHTIPFILIWFLALAAIALIVGKLITLVPDTAGSGIPQTDAEVMGRINAHWHRIIPAKFVEGTLVALAGLSLGREGPSIQLGGMSGKAVSRVLKRGRGEERLLITCGTAAGMSAAFHAPLTGVLFAVEEIHKAFSAPLIISVMASSVVADFFVSQVLGMQPTLSYFYVTDLPHIDYILILLMGIVCGIFGCIHNEGMFLSKSLYAKLGERPYVKLLIGFAFAGVAAFVAPQLLCGGDAIVEIMNQPASVPLKSLVLLLVGKYLLTSICFGSNAPGGTLFPLVVMGGLLGCVYGATIIGITGISTGYLSNFTLLGIAGLFAAVVRAPITAIVLVFELTGSFDALLSVTLVSMISYITANVIGTSPFYEKLVADLLGTLPGGGSFNGDPGEKVISDFVVGIGSIAEGSLIKDLSWPKDMIILTVHRAGLELMPKAETRLMALDELTVLMNSDKESGVEQEVARICEPNYTMIVSEGEDDEE